MDNLSTLSARALHKSFSQGARTIEVLHGISLEVHPGEKLAILGPSGAGKSTLLHILGLMERPTSGQLVLQGQEAAGLSDRARARLRNAGIGFLFQFHHLLPELSVLENVQLPRQIHGESERSASGPARRLLASLGLENHLHKRPAALSGGEQQRVALARALVMEPRLILADEPTGNLDKENGERVLEMLWSEARRRQASVVIVTHQEEMTDQADRWLRLRDGRMEATGKGGLG